jgi:hypothetical protein
MKKGIPFGKLSWPAGMNLDYLAEVIPEERLKGFILGFAKLDRKKRRIVLPSQKCIVKVLCHYLWDQIERGEKSWYEIKEELKGNFGSLKDIGLTKSKVIEMYEQREKEIEKEKRL